MLFLDVFFDLCCLGLPRSDRPSVSDLSREDSNQPSLSVGGLQEQRLTNRATGTPTCAFLGRQSEVLSSKFG